MLYQKTSSLLRSYIYLLNVIESRCEGKIPAPCPRLRRSGFAAAPATEGMSRHSANGAFLSVRRLIRPAERDINTSFKCKIQLSPPPLLIPNKRITFSPFNKFSFV